MSVSKIAASIAAALLALSAPAGAAEKQSFGSPLLRAPGTVAQTVACYFTNAGDTTVKFSRARMFRQDGSAVELNGNSCGAPNFELLSNRTCFLAAFGNPDRFGCKAEVAPGAIGQLRGSIELRDGSGKVLVSDQMTAGNGGLSDSYEQISSPLAYGGPSQVFAECRLVNLGGETVKVTGLQFLSIHGAPLSGQGLLSECGDKQTFNIRPGKTCAITMNYNPAPGDLRCRAYVTRKGAVRGTMKVYSAAYGEELNTHQMK